MRGQQGGGAKAQAVLACMLDPSPRQKQHTRQVVWEGRRRLNLCHVGRARGWQLLGWAGPSHPASAPYCTTNWQLRLCCVLTPCLCCCCCCCLQVNCQDANGHTALHIAALLNHHHLIGPLLAAGVDASLIDKSGRSAHDLALDKGSDDVLRQLDALKL